MNRILEIVNESILHREETIAMLRDRIKDLERNNNDMYNEINQLKAELAIKEATHVHNNHQQ